MNLGPPFCLIFWVKKSCFKWIFSKKNHITWWVIVYRIRINLIFPKTVQFFFRLKFPLFFLSNQCELRDSYNLLLAVKNNPHYAKQRYARTICTYQMAWTSLGSFKSKASVIAGLFNRGSSQCCLKYKSTW